jgi:hypothetical protein
MRDDNDDDVFSEGFDLNKEIEDVRQIVRHHETSYRTAMHAFVSAVYGLVREIMKSDRLQAELQESYNKISKTPSRATATWKMIKLCVHTTPSTKASAHRWSTAIDVGLAAGWSISEFREKLRTGGIDGILKFSAPGQPQQRRPSLNRPSLKESGDKPPLMALGPIDSGQLGLVEATRYVFVATCRDGKLDVTDCIKLTPAVARALEQARSKTAANKSRRKPMPSGRLNPTRDAIAHLPDMNHDQARGQPG